MHTVADWIYPSLIKTPSKLFVVTSSDASFVTVTVKFALADAVPSVTVTVKRYALSAFASEGISKSGAVINVTIPAEEILNNAPSSPPLTEYVKESPSASVAETVNADV